jgi:hypothetical protein
MQGSHPVGHVHDVDTVQLLGSLTRGVSPVCLSFSGPSFFFPRPTAKLAALPRYDLAFLPLAMLAAPYAGRLQDGLLITALR